MVKCNAVKAVIGQVYCSEGCDWSSVMQWRL